MAFQSVPDTAKVEVIGTRGGAVIEYVFHFKRAGGYNSTQIGDLATAVDQWMEDEHLDAMDSEYSYVRTRVTGLEFENDVQVEVNTNAGAGRNAGGGVPNNVTKAITFKTGLTGRSARGRAFIIAMPSSSLEGDETHVTQSAVDFWIALFEALRAVATAISWVMVVVSRTNGGAQRPTGATFTITDFGVSNLTTDSARFRLPKT